MFDWLVEGIFEVLLESLGILLESMIEGMFTGKLNQAPSNLPPIKADTQTEFTQTLVKPEETQVKVTDTPVKQEESTDWGTMSNADLWATKAKGASEEKILRSYLAITTYNNTIATGDDNRLAVTHQVLRELSGVKGLIVFDWIEAHADQVISHNTKFEMHNQKDASNPITSYNTRYRAEKIPKILCFINDQLLEGESPAR
ncbi:MAG: hypothetical protein WA919_14605 [Coleofasciculaceae cyanobacterium]